MKVLYIFQYGGFPNESRFSRHNHICAVLTKGGVEVDCVSASFHHLQVTRQRFWQFRKLSLASVNYLSVPVIPYSGSFGKLCSSLSFLVSLFFSCGFRRYDMVIFSCPNPVVGFFAFYHRIFFQSKTVCEVRDLWPLSIKYYFNSRLGRLVYHFFDIIMPFLYGKSDASIHLLKNGNVYFENKYGIKHANSLYLPNGFQREDAKPLSLGVFQKPYNFALRYQSVGGKVFIYTGGFGPPNNMNDLVSFILSHDLDGCLFLFFGDGPQQEAIQEIARKSPQFKRFIFFKHVNRRFVLEFLSIADAPLISIKDIELYSFGLSLNKLSDYISTGSKSLVFVSSNHSEIRYLDFDKRFVDIVKIPSDSLDISISFLSYLPTSKIPKEYQRNMTWDHLSSGLINFLKKIVGHPS